MPRRERQGFGGSGSGPYSYISPECPGQAHSITENRRIRKTRESRWGGTLDRFARVCLSSCAMQESLEHPDESIGLRKLALYRDVVLTEAGEAPARPTWRASGVAGEAGGGGAAAPGRATGGGPGAAAVIRNPWLGSGPSTDLALEQERIA